MYTYIHTHIYLCTRIYTHILITHIHTHTYHVYVYTHKYSFKTNTALSTYIYIYTHTYGHGSIHISTYTRDPYVHLSVNTYIRTNIESDKHIFDTFSLWNLDTSSYIGQ